MMLVMGYNASVSSYINILNCFISTEFRSLEVLNIFKAFSANSLPAKNTLRYNLSKGYTKIN